MYRDWHKADKDKLTKLFALKSAVNLKIFTHDGGNQFKMPHSKIEGVPRKPPTNGAVRGIPCRCAPFTAAIDVHRKYEM